MTDSGELNNERFLLQKIFDFLSNEDALKIFRKARQGLRSQLTTPGELGLTEKRYYTRLKRLVSIGLIAKIDGIYRLTNLGALVYQVLFEKLERALAHSEELALIDRLRKETDLSAHDVERIAEAVTTERHMFEKTYLEEEVSVKLVQSLETYDDFVVATKEIIERAAKEVYLATRYADHRLFDSIVKVGKPPLKIYVLDGDRAAQLERAQILKALIMSPAVARPYKLSTERPVQLKYTELPFSFVVVDGETVEIEILNAATKGFSMGLIFESPLLARKLTSNFQLLWNEAGQDALREFAERVRELGRL